MPRAFGAPNARVVFSHSSELSKHSARSFDNLIGSSRASPAQPLHVRQNVGVAPLVAIIVDAAVPLAIDNRRKRRVLDLTGLIFNHADAEGFPDFGEILSSAGEKRPTLGLRVEPAGIRLQDRRGVTFRIGGNAQEAIIRNVLSVEVPLNGGEISR